LPVTLRKENVADAFSAESKLLRGKNVLVIDDVITSGATMNACAKALVEAGAVKVYGYSLARGGIKSSQKPGVQT
jgi:predicted amidophosphoribosyltransferase